MCVWGPLEYAKIELENKKLDAAIETHTGTQSNVVSDQFSVAMPKLPLYDKGEDITAYLLRFESLAKLSNWPKETWATRLALLFSGPALNVYSTLSEEVCKDYDLLKDEILKAFRRTTEQYRKEFRYTKLKEENFGQYLTNLYRLFDFWVGSAKIQKTYEELREFIVTDQFFSSVPKYLRTFLMEQGIVKAREMAVKADLYCGAHHNYPQKSQHNKSKSYKGSKADNSADTSNPKEKDSSKSQAKIPKCYNCGEMGHYSRKCPKSPMADHVVKKCLTDVNNLGPFYSGTVNGANVSSILRDSGCTCIMVSDKLFPNLKSEELPKCSVADYLGRIDIFPVTKAYIDCPYYTGWSQVVVAPIDSCSMLVGNVKGVKKPKTEDKEEDSEEIEISKVEEGKAEVNVATRAQEKRIMSRKPVHPLILPSIKELNVANSEFVRFQAECPTLKEIRAHAEKGTRLSGKNSSYVYEYCNNVLVKKIIEAKDVQIVGKCYLVIPNNLRRIVLELAHESSLSGHFSHRKTCAKISMLYFWPGMTSDIYNFCRSCDVCQRFSAKGRLKKAEMVKMPVISVPFEKVAIDLVGPIQPRSSSGCSYVLTLVDYATSFPEAMPLKSITSIDIAEALVTIFSRVGIPKVIVSDRGPQFISDLMGKVYEMVGVKPIFTSPYHPMANGKIERQHSILKSILKKLCYLQPKEWDRYLPCALFAMREIPTDSKGFSPFELLYGRQARGPLSILHEIWSNNELSSETQSSYQFLLDLRSRLEETAQLAAKYNEVAMDKYKTYFDARSCKRSFSVGDEVLIMLPDSSNKLLMAWQGPYKVLEKVNSVDYVLDVGGKSKLFHVNLLKKYIRRAKVCLSSCDELTSVEVLEEVMAMPQQVKVCVIEESPDIELPTVAREKGTDDDLLLGEDLNSSQILEIKQLVRCFDHVFSNIPGCTNVVVHKIRLKTNEFFKSKQYPVPVHLREEFNKEVQELINLRIIEPSDSPYCNPVVMVKKPDNSYRLTLDFRALNSITIFDCEPMPLIDQDFHKFSESKYFSEIDITKAYYQIVLSPESRQYTAFQTSKGLMQFTRMPFGLSTACASYVRLMRKLFDGIPDISVYFDNILIFFKSWSSHLGSLKLVFEILGKNGLTAKSSKCKFGLSSIIYLGFQVSQGSISPNPLKCDKILKIDYPKSKKELMSVLGTCNFYQRFIPNIFELTAELSDKLKKKSPETFELSEELKHKFDALKNYFESDLILKLPDVTKTFVIRSDASHKAIGAVLLQYWNDVPHPICYAGRKLNSSEVNYAVMEKECLGLIFAVQKFRFYLIGKPFIVECDHKPLSFLESSKGKNSRIMRWSIYLQQFKYTVVYIPGHSNHLADIISRTCK